MPQNPIVPHPGGNSSVLNIIAATVVKATPGTVYRVSVTVAGTAAGSVYDANTTGDNTAAALVGAIPNAVGVTQFEWPCSNGILIVPGAGQTVSVSFS